MKNKTIFLLVGLKSITHSFLLLSFLGISVLTLNACSNMPSVAGVSDVPIPFSDHPAVLQGLTTDRRIELSIVIEARSSVSYVLESLSGSQRWTPQVQDRIARHFSPWAVDRVIFTGLAPEQRYRFRILDENKHVRDERIATTRSLVKDSARIALVSCASDHVDEKEQRALWKELTAHRPDYLFMLGDNVYADYDDTGTSPIRTPEALWSRYVESRMRIELYRQKELIPTLAIWDDHDTGRDNANRYTPTLSYAREIFFAFFPQSPLQNILERGPGLSFVWNAFGAEFYFLDDRSFRSENNAPVADETHFGKATEQWLFKQVGQNRPAWIISGDQFFGAYHSFESFEGNHPRSFSRFIRTLRKARRPLWFVSGDRHLTELQRIERPVLGFQTYELTTSPIHSALFADEWKEHPNPRQIHGASGTWNYAIVQMQARSQKLDLNIEAWGVAGKLLYREHVVIAK